MKFLPRPEHFFCVFVSICLLASAASCNSDEDPGSIIASTQFDEPALTFAENAGAHTISLTFDEPLRLDGEITIKATAIVPSCFSTTPVSELGLIRIPVLQGQTGTSFTMTPTDNASLDGVRQVKFTIASTSEGLVAGSRNLLMVSVTDDEAPVAASFDEFGMNVRENDGAAAKIGITFSGPVPADGVLVLDLESTAGYGVEFVTEPEAVNKTIFLPVTKGATSASIKLYPVNDIEFKADRNIKFNMIDATGGVAYTEDSFWATITEDDGQQLSTIASVRSMYSGSPVLLQNDVYIEGIVTSIDNTLAGRVVIEDATGALPIQLISDQALPRRGDIILVNVGQGLLRKLQSTLEVSQVSVFQTLGVDAFEPSKVSLSDLLGSVDRLQSRTVQLTGIAFEGADGVMTLRGDRIVTDGDRSIIVRTGANADFGSDVVPPGPVVVTGIFTDVDGLYIVYPQESKDVKKQGFMPPHGGSLLPRH